MPCSIERARFGIKLGTGLPTVPPSDDHTDGSWSDNDIYVGEWYMDTATNIVYTRLSDDSIAAIGSMAVTIYSGDDVIVSNRIVDLDGKTLKFTGTNTGVEFEGDTANGITVTSNSGYGGQFTSGDIGVYSEGDNIAVQGVGTSSGKGGVFTSDTNTGCEATSNSGIAIRANGNSYIETSGIGGTHDPSAVLHLESTTQGLLLPRMTTTERNAIASPAAGLVVFDTTLSSFMGFNGTIWGVIL